MSQHALFSNLNIDKVLFLEFDKKTFIKGQQYFFQKSVERVLISGSHLEASVQGSRSQPYHVSIDLLEKSSLWVCSCPVSGNCKHMAAALLEAKHLLAKHSGTSQKPSLKKASPKEPDSPSAVMQWMQALKEPTPTLEKAQQNQIVYVFNKNGRNLTLSVFTAYLKKDGEYSRIKNYNRSTLPSYATSTDQEIIPFLLTQKFNSANLSDLSLTEKSGPVITQTLFSTGRTRWADPNGPLLNWVEPEQASLEWAVSDKGSQHLRGTILGRDCFVFPTSPLLFFDLNKGEVGLATPPEDIPDIQGLLLAPELLPKQAESLKSNLEGLSHYPSLPQPISIQEVNLTKVKKKPLLHLSLKQVSLGYGWRKENHTLPFASLSFRYGDLEILPQSFEKQIQHFDGKRLISMSRSEKFERKSLDRMIKLGFIQANFGELQDPKNQESLLNCLTIPPHPEKFDQLYFSEISHAWEHFCDSVIPSLTQEGWEVTICPGFPFQRPVEVGEWFIDIDENSQTDNWFGLELGVEIDGKKVSLLPILLQFITHNSPTFIQDFIDSDTDSVKVKLPDGRYIQAPGDLVNRVLSVLSELYLSGNASPGQQLRLNRFDAEKLNQLHEAIPFATWKGGKEVRSLASKLKNFKGIQSQPQPRSLQAELRGYQKEGLSWLQFLREHQLAGVLADDMGLGKTIQILSYAMMEKESNRLQSPILVVAPTSVLPNWSREAKRFCPDLNLLSFYGPKRKDLVEEIPKSDLVLTTYPLLYRDKEILENLFFHTVILDEAQYIKNSQAKMTQVVCNLKSHHRFCLTGTPMENHLGELWSLFNFLAPGLLGDKKSFSKFFRNPIEKEGDTSRQKLLAQKLRPLMLRRTKEAVLSELPPKTEIRQLSSLEREQRELYESIRASMHKKVRDAIQSSGLAKSHIILLDALLKLRQVCCHPQLLKSQSAKQITTSSKFEQLMEMLPPMIEEGRKVLLFSQFTSMLQIIETACKERQIPFAKLTGRTRNREQPIEEFQSGQVPLFLLSLKAGGTGLNLTAADTVIHYDPWWNPAIEEQATDRAYRMGQDKPVFVYKMVCEGTVEEKILQMQEKKKNLASAIFDPKSSQLSSLSTSDIDALFEPI